MCGQACTKYHIFSVGKPTKVSFHVTVMSLDSINEGSMVRTHFQLEYSGIEYGIFNYVIQVRLTYKG